MILTRKCLQVDIFLTHRLSKELAFYEFASVNIEPCNILSLVTGKGAFCSHSLFDGVEFFGTNLNL